MACSASVAAIVCSASHVSSGRSRRHARYTGWTSWMASVSALEPAVRVEPLVGEGHASEVLLRAAKDADLLVVGSRGHGGFASARLGSVSLHCAQHGHCPVVVMRADRAVVS